MDRRGAAGSRFRFEEFIMGDTSVTKVESKHSPRGEQGQKYLAAGVHVAMRLWEDEQPGEPEPAAARDYETVGYVIGGRAELHIEGQMILLAPGDSWAVPRGASHSYKILEPFTAVEATSPPAFAHGRDRI
jgi:quercetin dioxygenase-like cupin family protein